MSKAGTVLLVGCGRMGGALARGWACSETVVVFDPGAPSDGALRRIDSLTEAASLAQPLTVIIAVKPQILPSVVDELRPLAEASALIVSVVAGATLDGLRAGLGAGARIVRAMPNTPAAVSRGITAAIASPDVDRAGRERVTALLSAVGEVVWLDNEAQMDAVTALSGSGPAYFFRFTEALAAAGVREGLDPEVATQLARATFTGAAALATASVESLDALRTQVTSPGGTTAAALGRFDDGGALDAIVASAVAAAARRSRELAG